MSDPVGQVDGWPSPRPSSLWPPAEWRPFRKTPL